MVQSNVSEIRNLYVLTYMQPRDETFKQFRQVMVWESRLRDVIFTVEC